jgi:hypothetical protein
VAWSVDWLAGVARFAIPFTLRNVGGLMLRQRFALPSLVSTRPTAPLRSSG